MITLRTTLALTLLAAAFLVGCENPAEDAESDTPEPGTELGVEQASADAPIDLPVPEDFEAEAETTINADNYTAQLDTLEAEFDGQ